jgi:methylmalonyl-CoA mutase
LTQGAGYRFDEAQWAELAAGERGGNSADRLPGLSTAADCEALPYADTTPGAFPFVRGPYATMYTTRPWTVRQYAGFSTAEASNAFYRQCLKGGQRGLSVAFDLPTHRGYDSDHPRVFGDVGKAGVAIDSVEDMALLFDGIPLDKISVSMTMNGAVLPILAAFIVAAEERGVPAERLSGTIQNDILKEFAVRNTYIYPPAPSMRIVADIIAYSSRHLPQWNPISVSGYHMQEAGATAVQELAFTIADGLAYARAAVERGLGIDDFAPRLSFFFGIGMDFLTEIAKLRAARALWAELVRKEFDPQNPNSLRLRMHCQTSGVSLTAQDPLNNVVRTTIEAMAGILGGTQSLHTNAFDEALALPSDAAARLARNTQLILHHETDLCSAIDPLGGSYFIERRTDELRVAARQLIERIDAMGGMIAAVESGFVQQEIARAAVERQVRLDRGLEKRIGVNVHIAEASAEPELRHIDNHAVRASQVERLQALRSARDVARVEATLMALEAGARSADVSGTNLLELAIDCMRARTTVGEVSERLERVFGRYTSPISGVQGVFAMGYGAVPEFDAIQQRVETFLKTHGRRPRLLVAKLGQDGHDRGAKVVASGFADAGFDVDLAPMFQTPEEVARVAIDNDVHVVGISTQAGAHASLLPQLKAELVAGGAPDILVICGGIIPEADRPALMAQGVAAIFDPAVPVMTSVADVLTLLERRVTS